jgi:hypothetical protein
MCQNYHQYSRNMSRLLRLSQRIDTLIETSSTCRDPVIRVSKLPCLSVISANLFDLSFLQIISFGRIFLITSLPSVLRWLQLKLKGKRLEMIFQLGRFGLRVFVCFICLKRKFYVFMMSLLTQTIFCSPFNFILIRSVAWGKYKPQNFKNVFYCNRKKFEWFMFQNIGGCCRSISLVWPPSTSWLKDWIEIEQGLSTPVLQLFLNCYSTVMQLSTPVIQLLLKSYAAVIQLFYNFNPLSYNCYTAVRLCYTTVEQLLTPVKLFNS